MKKWIPFAIMIPIMLVIFIFFRGDQKSLKSEKISSKDKKQKAVKSKKEETTNLVKDAKKVDSKSEEEDTKEPASTFTLDIPEITDEEIEDFYRPPEDEEEVVSEEDFNEIKDNFLYRTPDKKEKYAANRIFRGVLNSQYDESLGEKVMELNGYIIYKSSKEFGQEDAWRPEEKSGPLVYNRINNRMGIVTGKVLVTLKKEGDIRPLLKKYNLKIDSKFEMEGVFYLSEKTPSLGPKELSKKLGSEKEVKRVNLEIIESLDQF